MLLLVLSDAVRVLETARSKPSDALYVFSVKLKFAYSIDISCSSLSYFKKRLLESEISWIFGVCVS